MTYRTFYCRKCSKQLDMINSRNEGFSMTTGSKCTFEKYQCPYISNLPWYKRLFTTHSTVYARFRGDELVEWWNE